MGGKAKRPEPPPVDSLPEVIVLTRPTKEGHPFWPKISFQGAEASEFIGYDWATVHDDGASWSAGLHNEHAVDLEVVPDVIFDWLDEHDTDEDGKRLGWGWEFLVTFRHRVVAT